MIALVLVFCAAQPAPHISSAQQPIAPGSAPIAQPPMPAVACTNGTQASGALYRICMPTLQPWNGDLILYAHGYVAPTEPLRIPTEFSTTVQLADLQGVALATTSYSVNGLAVTQGVADLVDLVGIFGEQERAPDNVYLVGASEGGLITVLALERHADVFDGGLAMCGPYGDFRAQMDYLGDFRVAFDYFLPNLLPSSPISVPVDLIAGWDAYYTNVVKPAVTNPVSATLVDQLLAVSDAPFDAANADTKEQTIRDVLWYAVNATNDARAKLGGQPFENQARVYAGSANDAQLNERVQRFTADAAALDEIAARYQPTGQITVPLVTMHTTGDPVIPYWQASRYITRTMSANRSQFHRHIAVARYGHCTFTQQETLAAINQLVALVNNPPLVGRLFLPVVIQQRSNATWLASHPKVKTKSWLISKQPREAG